MTENKAEMPVEGALDEVRSAAKRLSKMAKDLESASRFLEQAAAKGELPKLKSGAERISTVHRQIADELTRLGATWLLDDAAVEGALEGGLMREVAALLKQRGVELHRYGSGWSASPLLLRVDAKNRTMKIDRKRLATLRPSVIANAVMAARQRPPVRPEQFIEVLYSAYQATVASKSFSNQPTRLGSAVPLSEVYRSLTLHPDSRREYPVEAFVRDLFVLDRSGLTITRDGLKIFFSSSTSSKGGGGVLTVLDDTGAPQNYFAVAFREVAS